jgi:hypothetical protein
MEKAATAKKVNVKRSIASASMLVYHVETLVNVLIVKMGHALISSLKRFHNPTKKIRKRCQVIETFL